MLNVILLYWSKSGNTRKVTDAIKEGLEQLDARITVKEMKKSLDVDYFDHDLVFLGFPSYQWLPPKPVREFLEARFSADKKAGRVKMGSPRVPGKHAVIYCTYSGPHTGKNEAIPAVKHAGQFLDHVGFNIAAEWYIPCEFIGREDLSTEGRLGDIRGLPTESDLEKISANALEIAKGCMPK